MGLFSSTKKTIVGTSVMRAIEDDHLPNSVRTGMTKAIFEEGDVSDYVLEELVGSIGVRADRAYEYAKKSYTHGLPSFDIVEASQGRAEILTVLSQMEGASVSLDYSFFGRPNLLHLGWMHLVSAMGYDPATNKLASLATAEIPDVFLHDLLVCIPEASASSYDQGTLKQWGKAPNAGTSPTRPMLSAVGLIRHTPIQVDPDATAPYWKIQYALTKMEKTVDAGDVLTLYQESLDVPIPESALLNTDHFHVKYVVNGVTKYWMYALGSGTHPTLDALFNVAPKVTGSFYPFIYFRYDKKSEIEDKSTPQYKTSKRLAKYYGMDYDEVSASIDENPDIKDVQQAMLIMALPANTENEVERKYLYTFFENWFYSKTAQYRTPVVGNAASKLGGDPNASVSSIVIQDKRFKMALTCAGIYRRRVVGNIGAVGKHDSGITEDYINVPAVRPTTDEPYFIRQVVKNHYYRRQVSPTLYDEVMVADLKMLYYVFEEYTSTGDDTDDILLIPLDRSITEEYSIIEKEELYARSLHFVFNSMQVIKVKWYQRGWFAVFIQVVGFFLAVITMQPYLAQIALSITAGVGAVISTVLALLQKLLINYVTGLLVKLFVKLIGVDLAFLVAIVGFIYGMAGTLEGSPINGAPWASDFLRMGNGLIKAVSETLNELMTDLSKAGKAFEAFKETAQKELEESNKLLETNNHLSPFTIFGESPNDFYNRTVHSGNAGINAIAAVTNYVDMALTLPKLNDTIGDTAYV